MNNFNQYNPYQNNQVFAPITNKTFVNSLQDALNRWSDYNSEMIYFDWYKNVAYNVVTNGRGEKTWTIIDLSEHKDDTVTEQNAKSPNVETLEDKVNKLTKMVEEMYGKYNAKQADIPTRNE